MKIPVPIAANALRILWDYLKGRSIEPSTAAGVAALSSALAIVFPEYGEIFNVFAAGNALAAMALPEGGKGKK